MGRTFYLSLAELLEKLLELGWTLEEMTASIKTLRGRAKVFNTDAIRDPSTQDNKETP